GANRDAQVRDRRADDHVVEREAFVVRTEIAAEPHAKADVALASRAGEDVARDPPAARGPTPNRAARTTAHRAIVPIQARSQVAHDRPGGSGIRGDLEARTIPRAVRARAGLRLVDDGQL